MLISSNKTHGGRDNCDETKKAVPKRHCQTLLTLDFVTVRRPGWCLVVRVVIFSCGIFFLPREGHKDTPASHQKDPLPKVRRSARGKGARGGKTRAGLNLSHFMTSRKMKFTAFARRSSENYQLFAFSRARCRRRFTREKSERGGWKKTASPLARRHVRPSPSLRWAITSPLAGGGALLGIFSSLSESTTHVLWCRDIRTQEVEVVKLRLIFHDFFSNESNFISCHFNIRPQFYSTEFVLRRRQDTLSTMRSWMCVCVWKSFSSFFILIALRSYGTGIQFSTTFLHHNGGPQEKMNVTRWLPAIFRTIYVQQYIDGPGANWSPLSVDRRLVCCKSPEPDSQIIRTPKGLPRRC